MRCASLAVLACVSCAAASPEHASRPAVPIKTACTASSRPPSSVAFDVRPGRRHSESRTIFVTNLSDEAKVVRVDQVSRLEGPCSGDWARQTPLNFVDADGRQPPGDIAVPPRGSLELRLGQERVNATWACTKMALAVWLHVGDEPVCADAGAWISAGADGE